LKLSYGVDVSVTEYVLAASAVAPTTRLDPDNAKDAASAPESASAPDQPAGVTVTAQINVPAATGATRLPGTVQATTVDAELLIIIESVVVAACAGNMGPSNAKSIRNHLFIFIHLLVNLELKIKGRSN
jgi:hypothetical protein